MNAFLQDTRYAARLLGKAPGFTTVAVLTVALGIGAVTAVYSVAHPLLLNPLPFEDGDRLAFIWQQDPRAGMSISPTGGMAEAWRDQSRTLEGVEIYGGLQFRRSGPDGAELISAGRVSSSFFDFLGVDPVLGRTFTEREAGTGARVALLDYGYWQREFGGRGDVVGETLRLDAEPYTVIGVAPAELAALESRDIWVGPGPGPQGRPGGSVIARIRPGVDDATVEAELALIVERLSPEHKVQGEWVPRLARPQDFLSGGLRNAIFLLAAAVTLVLLIASTNVAHLLLARGTARGREIAVRSAIGASRGRIVRQLLTESLLLGAAGGGLGFLLAWWGVDALVAFRPTGLEDLERAGVSAPVLLFSSGISLFTVLLFGLVPSLRTGAVGPATILKGAGTTTGRSGARARRALLVFELALTVVLLAGAGLLTRSLVNLQNREPGFRPEGLVATRTVFPESRYATPASRDALRAELLSGVGRIPGVTAATIASSVPSDYGVMVAAPERYGGGESMPRTLLAAAFVPADYFRTLGIPILEGRPFTTDEVSRSANVVVIGESMARSLWPGGSAVGGVLRFSESGEWITVVGVAADIAAQGLIAFPARRMQVHLPFRELQGGPPMPATFIVRTQEDIDGVASHVRSLVRSIDPEIVVEEIAPVEALLARTIAGPRFNALILTLLAALALCLAGVGLFGVLSYTVSRRTREIGIMKAIGAPSNAIFRSVLLDAIAPVALGLVLGLSLAVAAGRYAESFLHDTPPHDPVTLLGVSVVLLGISLLASYLPARRANRVDAMVAMQTE